MKYSISSTLLGITLVFACCKANAVADDKLDFSEIPSLLKNMIGKNIVPNQISFAANNVALIAFDNGFNSNRTPQNRELLPIAAFSSIDSVLLQEANTVSAKSVTLNWNVSHNWSAELKLQTVDGSAWLPHISIPRFITQDTEDWSLAAVEVVYTF